MIEQLLELEEGFRSEPYYCSEGYPTIGIGTKIGPKGAPLEHYCLTVTKRVAYIMLEDDLASIRNSLVKYRWYVDLDHARQVIIKSMSYQMGVSGVLKFKKMIAALEAKNWEEASKQALDSRWAKQTPGRAKRHSEVLLTGNFKDVEEYIGIDS